MASEQRGAEKQSRSDFATQAGQAQKGFVGEFVDYLKNNKKWWLTPIIVILLLLGSLMYLAGTAAAPFIYTLF